MCAMDVKLGSASKPNSQILLKKRSLATRFFTFVHELREELKKVSWTAKGELQLSTKMVVIAMFVFGLGIYVVDLVVKGALDGIGIIFHSLFG